jgi:hypothetical protein
MINIFRKTNKNRKNVASAVLILSMFVVFFVGDVAHAWELAEVGKALLNLPETLAITFVGLWTQVVIAVAGSFLTIISMSVVGVAKYNDFINVTQIGDAWEIIRDMCNMFFILILLIISFATILRVESYNMKKWLPKLVLMAIIINFSKMFCGLIIDFSQVVMLTFSSKLNGAAFFQAMQVQTYLNSVASSAFKNFTGDGIKFFDSAVGLVAGSVFLIISVIVMLVILLTLVMRIVMLWIYVVLSPLAFVLSAFPGGQKYASQWWSDFTKQVIIGPVLMFFVWLSLVMAETMNGIGKTLGEGRECASNSISILCPDNFLGFILAIGMLIGGLIVASQIGGAAGGAASRGMAWAKKGAMFGSGAYLGMKATKWASDKTVSGVKAGARAGTSTGLGLARGFDRALGRKAGKEGGYVGGKVNTLKNLATFDKFKTGSVEKVEAEKALYSYHTKKKSAMGIKDEAKREEAMKKLRLSHNGEDYKLDEERGNFYRVNKKGLAVDKKGEELEDQNNIKDRAIAARGSRIKGSNQLTEMRDGKADMFMGMSSAKSGAWAAAKMATDEKVNEEQKKIAAANISPDMMMQRIKDDSTSGAEKMALALTMAVKDGFKGMNHGDVQTAKKALGSNQLLLKQFNDETDKKYAHLNYDMTNESGRAKFKKRFEAGKVEDVMHESAYKGDVGKEVLKTIHASKGDVGFKKYVEKIGEKSNVHKDAIKEGLTGNFKEGSAINKDGDLDVMRSAMYDLTGDLAESLKGAGGEMDKAVTDFFGKANTKQLASIDKSAFDTGKISEKLGKESASFRKSFIDNVSAMTDKQIEGIRKHKDANNDLVDKYSTIVGAKRNMKKTREDKIAAEEKSEQDKAQKKANSKTFEDTVMKK